MTTATTERRDVNGEAAAIRALLKKATKYADLREVAGCEDVAGGIIRELVVRLAEVKHDLRCVLQAANDIRMGPNLWEVLEPIDEVAEKYGVQDRRGVFLEWLEDPEGVHARLCRSSLAGRRSGAEVMAEVGAANLGGGL